MKGDLRDQTGGYRLEEQSEPGQGGRQVAPDACAHGQEAREQRGHREEQRDDEEREGEPGRQEVMVCPAVVSPMPHAPKETSHLSLTR